MATTAQSSQSGGLPRAKPIRFEDLGEPVQQLLQQLQGNVDMSLLEYLSVRDMAKILDQQVRNVRAEAIWADLKLQLEERKRKRFAESTGQQKQRQEEELARQRAIAEQEEAVRRKQAAEEEQRRRAAEEEEQRRRAAEESMRRRAAEEEQRRRAAEEEQRRRAAEEELRRRAAEDEQRRAALDEQQRQKWAREEAERQQRWAREEAERQQRWSEEEAQRRAELAAEDERRRREESMRRRAAAEEEQRRRAAEEELRRRAAEEEERRRAAEELELERQRKAAEAAAAEQEARRRALEDRRRGQERRLQELVAARARLEAEEADIVGRQQFQLAPAAAAGAPAQWFYWCEAKRAWRRFLERIEVVLEEAYQKNTPVCQFTADGGNQWAANLGEMYARSEAAGIVMPLFRRIGDEMPVPAEAGPAAVWSSLNPLTEQWERFPRQVCRILEVKYRNAQPSVDILIMGQLKFSIVYSEMRQVDQERRYRHVQRSMEYPVWQQFNPALPGWQTLPCTAALEETFASGVQSAQIINPSDPTQQGGAELDFAEMCMRLPNGSAAGVRRHMQAEVPVASSASRAVAVPTTAVAPLPPQAPAGYARAAEACAPPPTYVPSTSIPRTAGAVPGSPPAGTGAYSVGTAVQPQREKTFYLLDFDTEADSVEEIIAKGYVRAGRVNRHELREGINAIGRDPPPGDARYHPVVVPRPDVSRMHCVVEIRRTTTTGGLAPAVVLTAQIEDVRSASGTYLRLPSGEFHALGEGQRYTLPHGTFVALGNSLVQVVLE